MKWAGLSGGIGSGKSTVAARLTGYGAVCIDVDQVSRRLQQPGQPVFEAMTDRWGPRIVLSDGTLDRKAVAAITFDDDAEMAALMALTSDTIEAAIEAIATEHVASDRIVILESALLAPNLYGIDGLIVVDVPGEIALARLCRDRGMAADEARSRMARQPSREQRRAMADFVIDNTGDEAALEAQVMQLTRWLELLPPGHFQRRS
jgi:dephospho-CoA kinase